MSAPANTTVAARRRLWPRFTLRLLLVAITAVCIVLAIWTHRAREQRRVVEHIRQTSGDVAYDWEPHVTLVNDSTRSPVPAWLLNRLGEDFFHSVDRAYVGSEVDLEQVSWLRSIRVLEIGKTDLSDDEVQHVARLGGLKELIIHHDWLNPKYGATTNITDRSLSLLAQMSRLESVSLDGNCFTSAGLAALAESRSLHAVFLNYCDDSVTDDDVEPFRRAGRVKTLVIRKWTTGKGQETVIEEWRF